MYRTDDQRIQRIREVFPPEKVLMDIPISETVSQLVLRTRQVIHEIMAGNDDRLLVIVGPCSIHDVTAAREYAEHLSKVRSELSGDLEILMRVYFEKPRTTIGWKGLINDPNLDNSFDINKGLKMARELLLDINTAGVPCGSEFLDIVTGQYYADLVSWGAIGARTTESQVHREMASGLSCPVGFKNGTDGNLKIAADACRTSSHPHIFLSPTKAGTSAIFFTTGNEDTHIILRGGKTPNYDAESIEQCMQLMSDCGLKPQAIVDFSHGNSRKQHERQLDVGEDVAGQLESGEDRIFGVMIESHLKPGRQDNKGKVELEYGKSITDACLGWDDTAKLLKRLATAVQKRREAR